MKKSTKFIAFIAVLAISFMAFGSVEQIFASETIGMENMMNSGRGSTYEENMKFFENGKPIGSPYFITDQNWKNIQYAEELAEKIVDSKTDVPMEKAKLLYDWMRKNVIIDYNKAATNDDDDGYWNKSCLYTNKYKGICGDFARMYMEMCWTQDIPCIMVYGVVKNTSGTWPHAWNYIYIDGEWLLVDPYYNNQFAKSIEDYSKEYCINHGYLYELVNDWSHQWMIQAINYGLVDFEWAKMESEAYNEEEAVVSYIHSCSREEFAMLAINLVETYYDQPIDEILADRGLTPGHFTDTNNPDVLAANALGIVGGYGDGRFGPDGSIKRQEAAAILYRTATVLGIGKVTADISVFTDLNQIGTWAHESVAFCKATGIMQGTSTTTFSPVSTYNVDQCIVTLVRLYEYAMGK